MDVDADVLGGETGVVETRLETESEVGVAMLEAVTFDGGDGEGVGFLSSPLTASTKLANFPVLLDNGFGEVGFDGGVDDVDDDDNDESSADLALKPGDAAFDANRDSCTGDGDGKVVVDGDASLSLEYITVFGIFLGGSIVSTGSSTLLSVSEDVDAAEIESGGPLF